MKTILSRLSINTTYPNGYGSDAARGLEGEIDVQTGPATYEYTSHTLSDRALQAIAEIALADFVPPPQAEITFPGIVVGTRGSEEIAAPIRDASGDDVVF